MATADALPLFLPHPKNAKDGRIVGRGGKYGGGRVVVGKSLPPLFLMSKVPRSTPPSFSPCWGEEGWENRNLQKFYLPSLFRKVDFARLAEFFAEGRWECHAGIGKGSG